MLAMPVAIKGDASSDVGLGASPSGEDQGRVVAHILKEDLIIDVLETFHRDKGFRNIEFE